MYLVAYYFQKPKHNRVRTQIAGWQKQAGTTAYDEQVAVTRNLRNKDYTTAKIILDFKNKRVLKNDWGGSKDFTEMFKYFHHSYPQYTTPVMQLLDPEFLSVHFPAPETQPVQTIDTSGTISST
jgi:hypothetical protein